MKIKNVIKANFSIIVNAIVNDPSLSAGAKGVYCYLASKPNDWQFYIEDIAKHFSDSPAKIKRFIKELETTGWLVRRTEARKGQGKGFDWVWIVAEEPFTDKQIEELKPNPNTRRDDYNSDPTMIVTDYDSEITNIVKSGGYNNTDSNSKTESSTNTDSPILRNTIPYGNTITSYCPQGENEPVIPPCGDILGDKRPVSTAGMKNPTLKTKPEDVGLVRVDFDDVAFGDWERLLNWFEYNRRHNNKVVKPYCKREFKQTVDFLKEQTNDLWFYAVDVLENAIERGYIGFGNAKDGLYYKLKSAEDYELELSLAKDFKSRPYDLPERVMRYKPMVLDLALEYYNGQIETMQRLKKRYAQELEDLDMELPTADMTRKFLLEKLEKYDREIAEFVNKIKWVENEKKSL